MSTPYTTEVTPEQERSAAYWADENRRQAATEQRRDGHRAAGRAARYIGRAADTNPNEPGSFWHEYWEEGWQDADAAIGSVAALAVTDALEAGRRAARRGHAVDVNPYSHASNVWEAWDQGWQEENDARELLLTSEGIAAARDAVDDLWFKDDELLAPEEMEEWRGALTGEEMARHVARHQQGGAAGFVEATGLAVEVAGREGAQAGARWDRTTPKPACRYKHATEAWEAWHSAFEEAAPPAPSDAQLTAEQAADDLQAAGAYMHVHGNSIASFRTLTGEVCALGALDAVTGSWVGPGADALSRSVGGPVADWNDTGQAPVARVMTAVGKALEDGIAAAQSRRPLRANPHPHATPEWVAWCEGWESVETAEP